MTVIIRKSSRVVSAKISPETRLRFYTDFSSNSGLNVEVGRGWSGLVIHASLEKTLASLAKLGWVRDGNQNVGSHSTVSLAREDGSWPLWVSSYTGATVTRLCLGVFDSASDEKLQTAVITYWAKKIMPSGFQIFTDTAMWTKKGGYSGEKAIDSAVAKAVKLGFRDRDHTSSGSPDGSFVGSGTVYVKDDLILLTSRSYGVVKQQNHFSVTLKFREV